MLYCWVTRAHQAARVGSPGLLTGLLGDNLAAFRKSDLRPCDRAGHAQRLDRGADQQLREGCAGAPLAHGGCDAREGA
eukprot:7389884-Prymnesium_polylepis.2